MKRFLAQCYIWLLLIVLYAPIVFIAVFSFTESKVLGNWTGFSTKLYANLFTGDMQGSGSLMSAIQNTLLIALIAAIVSSTESGLGTAFTDNLLKVTLEFSEERRSKRIGAFQSAGIFSMKLRVFSFSETLNLAVEVLILRLFLPKDSRYAIA